jgi:mannose-6-phosphate isomerase-like protein (cupin superfamily)
MALQRLWKRRNPNFPIELIKFWKGEIMYKLNKSEVPQRQRGGLLSHILLQQGDVPNTQLSVTWVEVEPDASQKPHKHLPEQSYIIIQGQGEMTVGEESCSVEKGDIIHIPSNVEHYLKNQGDKTLIYISASTPAYDFKALYDEGNLKKQ